MTLREWYVRSFEVSWGCHILYSQSFILSREIALSKELLLKSRSIFDAQTFWTIFVSVGRLKDKEFVRRVLFVFFARESDFFVWIVSNRESLVCWEGCKVIIWRRYSRDSCRIRLNSLEIWVGVSFLYRVSERKFSILLKIASYVGWDEPWLSKKILRYLITSVCLWGFIV